MKRDNTMSNPNRGVRATTLAACLIVALPVFAPAAGRRAEAPAPAARPSDARPVSASYAGMPMRFEVNDGQTDGQVRFLSRGAGYTLFLTPGEAVLRLIRRESAPHDVVREPVSTPPAVESAVLRMAFAGANPRPGVEGVEELPGRINYFVGDRPEAWRTDVKTYAKVRYTDVYPGVDLVFYGNQKQLEYDFVVAPGADPARIRLAFEGASSVEVDADGHLALETSLGTIRQQAPVLYQQTASGREAVSGRYTRVGDREVGFAVDAYDPALPLVIDPVLAYSTYLGGAGTDIGNRVAADAAGNAYVIGSTGSGNFPTKGEIQGNAGDIEAFVTKIDTNATGSASLVYSTFLGGAAADLGNGIAVDNTGSAYVTGTTFSGNFPTVNPIQGEPGDGAADAFVARLNAAGNALVYSTYLGGALADMGEGIAVDPAGNAYVTGQTFSADFPFVGGFQGNPDSPGVSDVFVTKINAAGTTRLYSTYLGGVAQESGLDIAADAVGGAYVTGFTASPDYPTRNPLQADPGDVNTDAFVSKIDTTATGTPSLVFSTYLGGNLADSGNGIDIDNDRNVYVAGTTSSINFFTQNPIQIDRPGIDAFLSKLNPTGTALIYSTYLGGGLDDSGNDVAVDNQTAYVVGRTASIDFPLEDQTQSDPGDNDGDAFVTRINRNGTNFVYSTYLGGSGDDDARGVAHDGAGNAYVTGRTASADFPTQGPFATDPGDRELDAFLARLSTEADLGVTVTSTPDPVRSGGQITYTVLVTNNGPGDSDRVTVRDTTPAGTTFASATSSQGTCTTPAVGGTGEVSCNVGTLVAGASATVTVVLNVTAANGSTVTNTFTVTGSGADTIRTNNEAMDTTNVIAAIVQPTITSAAKVKSPFRIKLTGTNFQPGVQVFIGAETTPYTNVKYIDTTMLLLKKGSELSAKFPKGQPVTIRVVNPDGGQATTTFTR